MTPKTKKLLLFAAVFATWLALDVISKDWADTSLANRSHPLPVHITAAEAGKPLREVLAARFGWTAAEAAEHMMNMERLEPAGNYQPTDKVYGPGPAATARGFYVFWRDDGSVDKAPRRIDKNERSLVTSWLTMALDKKGMPEAEREQQRAEIQQRVGALVTSWTFADWLPARFRKVDADDVASLAPRALHPITSAGARLSGDEVVKDGEAYLLTEKHVDVMGDWWKFVYAENPNAAFGFMKGVPEATRHVLFLILNLLAFIVISSIVWRLPPGGWLVYVAFAGILAGAAGNFIDRLRFGYVIDFIDWDLGFTHWPTFNVADIAISVGVVVLILDITFNPKSPLVARKKPAKKGPRGAGEDEDRSEGQVAASGGA